MTFRNRAAKVTLGALATLVVTLVAAPPSFAAPTLEVSATSGLKEGQTLTIEGSGFAPNLKGIAVGQCRETYKGPSDCNLSGGATFRNADASGAIESVTVKLAVKFGDVDCTKEQCIIAAAPLPTTSGPEEVAANTVTLPLYFGDAKPAAAPAAAAPAPSAPVVPAVTTTDSVAANELSTTGEGDRMGIILLAGAIGLLAGVGIGLNVKTKRAGAGR